MLPFIILVQVIFRSILLTFQFLCIIQQQGHTGIILSLLQKYITLPQFKKKDYPYYFVHYEDLGHEVAVRILYDFDKSMWFIDNYIVRGAKIKRDDLINDPTIERLKFGSAKPSDLY